jgi:hypothetical protein
MRRAALAHACGIPGVPRQPRPIFAASKPMILHGFFFD